MGFQQMRDRFADENLPPRELWPDIDLSHPAYRYPQRLNCVAELLDRHIETGSGGRHCLLWPGGEWTYADLHSWVNRIAHVLVEDLGLVPGNRVLLRAANTPMMCAAYLAVIKAGGIAVATMPLLRSGEISPILEKAAISHALCDIRLREDMDKAATASSTLRHVVYFQTDGADGLEQRAAAKPEQFQACDTAADDICLIAFTSGTTGMPKGTMHFHRDMLAICDGFSAQILRPNADDRFIGSPPLAFTFGLGGLLLFPLRAGASSVLLEQAPPPKLAEAIDHFRATICFTAAEGGRCDFSSLRKGVSAGEHLPPAILEAFREATGITLINGIGATEMLHIFISAREEDVRPGATGKPVPGYQACVMDDSGSILPPGVIGRLAVKGPTGCRYLDDARQKDYVHDGWNLTGDSFLLDEDGYFWYQARTDDMIVSSGYNISGPEVENALLTHPAVRECAVIGVADDERGQVVKAFIVPNDGFLPAEALAADIQTHVKQVIAPYKYPRRIAFLDALPKTQTGKLQRFRLREMT